jgi:hypothetical protein
MRPMPLAPECDLEGLRFWKTVHGYLLASATRGRDVLCRWANTRVRFTSYGSFLQSRVYHGGVTCSDCHEPHSLKLRASGNGVCAQCHLPSKYDSTSHHFKMGSVGSCVECHMPTTNYMVIQPRHDHSIRVLRPDLSVKIGASNACNKCHSDRTPKWADENINKWYAKRYRGYQTYAEALYDSRTGASSAEGLLVRLADDEGSPDIARATALSELNRYLSPSSIEAVRLDLSNDDPMVRASALDALELAEPAVRLRLAFNLLNDPVRAVRIKAAPALASVPVDRLTAERRTVFEKVIDEYVERSLPMRIAPKPI